MAFPDRRREQALGVSFGCTLSLTLLGGGEAFSEAGMGLVLILCMAAYLFMSGGLEERLQHLGRTLLGGIYLGLFLPYWALLFRMPDGRRWVFFVLLVIMIGDSVAYFVGNLLGGRKLAPELSPGKTVAGAWGYVAGSVIAGYLSAWFLLPSLGWFEALGLSLLLSIFGQVGDLFESWLKRVFAVKNSGGLLPGHGGLLDRLDSLIFPAVLTTVYLKAFH